MEDYRRIVTLCNWSDETATATLKAISSNEILDIIEKKRTLETCLIALIKTKNPLKDKFKYEEELSKIRQSDSETIENNESKIRLAFRDYCLSADIKQSEHSMREEESFIKSLYPRVKIEMSTLRLHFREDIK